MRVSSPIGELPFEPRQLTINHRGIEVVGVMGVWPARVQVDVTDVPALARLIAKPAALAASIIAVLLGLRRLARPHR